MNYTYMLRCADGSFYTGWTNNLEKRVKEHNAGRGGRYTRAHRPVELCYYEIFDTQEEAMHRIFMTVFPAWAEAVPLPAAQAGRF